MTLPVNFDSMGVDAILNDWLTALSEQGAEAVVVLGPVPTGTKDDREVLAVHPPRFVGAAIALAHSPDFGASWRDSDAPMVAWQDISRASSEVGNRWRRLWLAHGQQTLVRVAFPLPAARAFECFMFTPRTLANRSDAANLAWSAFNVWPTLRRSIATQRVSLSPRELESLNLAFEGLTARETSLRMDCTERTVNYHLANAMAKLHTDNKLSAVQRACWIGLI
ncbi:MAG: LuxR family transcriptional regulator [Comamonadaceae bacterium]|jgi:DNA-binding CsgD family transcriptional regulator|nr:LuxR family transcriptional regulator [Comamonadaceae bacterium]